MNPNNSISNIAFFKQGGTTQRLTELIDSSVGVLVFSGKRIDNEGQGEKNTTADPQSQTTRLAIIRLVSNLNILFCTFPILSKVSIFDNLGKHSTS